MKTLEQIQQENRKLIILANNKEAKTYEEALEMESKQEGCQLQSYVSKFSPKHKKLITSTILWDEGEDCAGNERFYCCKDDSTFTIIKKDCQIIGKPLTLSRVLIALDACNEDTSISLYGIIGDMLISYMEDADMNIIGDWDRTKETLEQQSEETQRTIKKLLKNVKNKS